MSKPFQVCCPNCSHRFVFKRVNPEARRRVQDRFWEKVYCDPNTGCFIWYGAVDGSGRYGSFRLPSDDPYKDSDTAQAHRFAWEMEHGPIPEGLVVCHKCDNPRCVNTDHHFLGTQKENMRDCSLKGRKPCKMTVEDALKIKQLSSRGVSLKQICIAVGRPKSTVQAVLDGRTWAHVTLNLEANHGSEISTYKWLQTQLE